MNSGQLTRRVLGGHLETNQVYSLCSSKVCAVFSPSIKGPEVPPKMIRKGRGRKTNGEEQAFPVLWIALVGGRLVGPP